MTSTGVPIDFTATPVADPPDPEVVSESTPLVGSSDSPRLPAGVDEPLLPICDRLKAELDAKVESAPPPSPPVIEIDDLAWNALGKMVKAGDIRANIESTVSEMEKLLCKPGGAEMLFDLYRASPEDRAIQVPDVGEMPLWFIGDLHGDLLALEAALTLIYSHPQYGTRHSRIVFLGDLFDDEGFGLEVLLRIFELIVAEPEQSA